MITKFMVKISYFVVLYVKKQILYKFMQIKQKNGFIICLIFD